MAKPKTYPYRALGLKIVALRESRHMTQRQLAEKIGKSEGYFGRIDSGESRPSQKTLRRIARALNASYVELAILAEWMTEDDIAALDALPDRADLLREMNQPDIPRDYVAEAWAFVQAKIHIARQAIDRDMHQDAIGFEADQEERRERAGC